MIHPWILGVSLSIQNSPFIKNQNINIVRLKNSPFLDWKNSPFIDDWTIHHLSMVQKIIIDPWISHWKPPQPLVGWKSSPQALPWWNSAPRTPRHCPAWGHRFHRRGWRSARLIATRPGEGDCPQIYRTSGKIYGLFFKNGKLMGKSPDFSEHVR